MFVVVLFSWFVVYGDGAGYLMSIEIFYTYRMVSFFIGTIFGLVDVLEVILCIYGEITLLLYSSSHCAAI